jgi:cyanate permease
VPQKDPIKEINQIKNNLAYTLCLIQFLSQCAFTQMSPFYPLKAKEKGVEIVWVGLVIGIMAVAQIFSCFVVGVCLHKIGGRHVIIMFGSLLIIA